jgi:hypothetical protein
MAEAPNPKKQAPSPSAGEEGAYSGISSHRGSVLAVFGKHTAEICILFMRYFMRLNRSF